jgi:hypothetical protein
MSPNRTTVELEPARRGLVRSSKSSHARDPAKQLWLDAWADPVAGVKAFSTCITTCNLCGDGDWRLVIADADKKLKVGLLVSAAAVATKLLLLASGNVCLQSKQLTTLMNAL